MRDPSALVLWSRVAFGAIWIAVQGAFIATAGSRSDAAFGFRMFSEASSLVVHLSRVVAKDGGPDQTIPVKNGNWKVTPSPGSGLAGPTRRAWRDRIHDGELVLFDKWFAASYSAQAQVDRWHAALDDYAAHFEPDGETKALVLEVTVKRNGHDPVTSTFTDPVRTLPSASGTSTPSAP